MILSIIIRIFLSHLLWNRLFWTSSRIRRPLWRTLFLNVSSCRTSWRWFGNSHSISLSITPRIKKWHFESWRFLLGWTLCLFTKPNWVSLWNWITNYFRFSLCWIRSQKVISHHLKIWVKVIKLIISCIVTRCDWLVFFFIVLKLCSTTSLIFGIYLASINFFFIFWWCLRMIVVPWWSWSQSRWWKNRTICYVCILELIAVFIIISSWSILDCLIVVKRFFKKWCISLLLWSSFCI